MGLTIHFSLQAAPDADAARAGALVRQFRQRALGFKRRGRVDRVHPLGNDAAALRWAEEWLSFPNLHRPDRKQHVPVAPLEGTLFPVEVGRDCEPLWLGLCRYPLSVRVDDRLWQTGLRGWRLAGFCKTQYASLHGWEPFFRCHTAVIDLLESARRLGFKVEIQDEGGYWPGRDREALRRNLDRSNTMVAATAGVLKDLNEDGDGAKVEAPILGHPQFEHLEAEGESLGYADLVRKTLR